MVWDEEYVAKPNIVCPRPRAVDLKFITTHNYGMVFSKHRTSFALDSQTIDRLRRLSARWNVSQAEVVRRAVEIAERQDSAAATEVGEQLRSYRRSGKLNPDDANVYLREVHEDRRHWRGSS